MTFRPALRPGAPLLRRDATNLQVGTSPGVVISDQPGLLALLRLTDGTRDVERLQAYADSNIPELDCDVAALMRQLLAIGVVYDSSRWSAPQRRGLDAEARHADLSSDDPAQLTRRAGFRVAFHADTPSGPAYASSTRTSPTCWWWQPAANRREQCSSGPPWRGLTICSS